MDISKNDLEGLKLLSDWSKWLFAVESVLIGVIFESFKPDSKFGTTLHVHPILHFCITLSVVCFFASVAASTFLLGGLPGEAIRLAALSPEDRQSYKPRLLSGLGRPNGWFKLTDLYACQQVLFLVGLGLFGASISIMIYIR